MELSVIQKLIEGALLIPMEKKILVGAGSFGRTLQAWFTGHVTFDGFVDDDEKHSVSRLGTVSWLASLKEPTSVYIAIGDAKTAEGIFAKLSQNPMLSFPPLVHPTAITGGSMIPRGAILCPYVVVGVDVMFGEFVLLNAGVAISHHCVIASFSRVHGGARVLGNAKVGVRSFIGANATIRNGVAIGDDVVIGCGSVVLKHCESGSCFVGNPATRKKNN